MFTRARGGGKLPAPPRPPAHKTQPKPLLSSFFLFRSLAFPAAAGALSYLRCPWSQALAEALAARLAARARASAEECSARTLPALGRPLSCRRFHILSFTSSRNTLSHPLSHPLFHMGPDPAAIGPVPAEHGSGDGHILSPAVAFTMSLQVLQVRVAIHTLSPTTRRGACVTEGAREGPGPSLAACTTPAIGRNGLRRRRGHACGG